jgi:hypothetical protein
LRTRAWGVPRSGQDLDDRDTSSVARLKAPQNEESVGRIPVGLQDSISSGELLTVRQTEFRDEPRLLRNQPGASRQGLELGQGILEFGISRFR